MPPKKDQCKEATYALLWFISTRERYIVETIKLPKTRRKKGDVCTILWEDPNTQISQRYKVKILEFDDEKNKLENVLVDEDGNLCEEGTKLFYKSVLDKKKKLQEEAKNEIAANKTQKNNLAHKIAQTKPLFDFSKKPSTQHLDDDDSLQQRRKSITGVEIASLESNSSSTNTNNTQEASQAQCVKNFDRNTGRYIYVDETKTYDKENMTNLLNCGVAASDNIDIGALHTFLPVTASEENVQFLKQIYTGLVAAYEHQEVNIDEKVKSFKVDARNKREISPKSGIFFPIDVIEKVEKKAVTETGVIDWKIIVKLALNEVYGECLGNYCAVGRVKNSLRPPIDASIYNAIFDWILLKSTEKIEKQDYTAEITKNIGNKRNSKSSNYSSTDTISRLDLQFFQKVIGAVTKENQWQKDSDNNLHLLNSRSRGDFLRPGPTKDRIAENYNIFFPKSTIAYIEKRTEILISPHFSDWKNLVKEALISVYGKYMALYCAKGNQTSRVSIHPVLYQAILAWANSRSETNIDENSFANHINKIAYNKRKALKRKSTSDTADESSHQNKKQRETNPEKFTMANNTLSVPHESIELLGSLQREPLQPEPLQLESTQPEPLQPPRSIQNSDTESSDYSVVKSKQTQEIDSTTNESQRTIKSYPEKEIPLTTQDSSYGCPENEHSWTYQNSSYGYPDYKHPWPSHESSNNYPENQYTWTSQNSTYTCLADSWATLNSTSYEEQSSQQSGISSSWQHSNYTDLNPRPYSTQHHEYNHSFIQTPHDSNKVFMKHYIKDNSVQNPDHPIVRFDENRTLTEL